jgi:tetratricopeptide (TPR) repeat protein
MAALATFVLAHAERHVRIPRGGQLVFGAGLALALAVTLVAVFARYGSPSTLAARGYDAVAAPPPRLDGDLNRRLFNLSSNARVFSWRVAWQDARDHPSFGSGAGTYEQYWLRHRPVPGKVIDAHSLYLETLAELGPVGLVLLVAALGLPLAGAVKARRHSLVSAAFGAYVAYLAHAAVDWDWEMPAVTVAALFCGLAILVAGRRDGKSRSVSQQVRVSALVVILMLSGFAVGTLVGNSALAAAEAAVWDDPEKAEAEAQKATRWAFWSSEPWRVLAEAQLAKGDSSAAHASLRKAIAREPRDWNLWYELALATDDRRAALDALDKAAMLNPRSREIAQLRQALDPVSEKATVRRTNRRRS